LLRKKRSRSQVAARLYCDIFFALLKLQRLGSDCPYGNPFLLRKKRSRSQVAARLYCDIFFALLKLQRLGSNCPYGNPFLLRKKRSRSQVAARLYCDIFFALLKLQRLGSDCPYGNPFCFAKNARVRRSLHDCIVISFSLCMNMANARHTEIYLIQKNSRPNYVVAAVAFHILLRFFTLSLRTSLPVTSVLPRL